MDDNFDAPQMLPDQDAATQGIAKKQDDFLKTLSPAILQQMLGAPPAKQKMIQEQLAHAQSLRAGPSRANPSPAGALMEGIAGAGSNLASGIKHNQAMQEYQQYADKQAGADKAVRDAYLKMMGVDPDHLGGGAPSAQDMTGQQPPGSPAPDPMMKGGDVGQAQGVSLEDLLSGNQGGQSGTDPKQAALLSKLLGGLGLGS